MACLACSRSAALFAAPLGARALSLRFDMVDMQRVGAGIQVPRPPKRASRRSAEVSERVLQIQSGLAGQDKRRADYRKTLPAKTSNRGLLYLCVPSFSLGRPAHASRVTRHAHARSPRQPPDSLPHSLTPPAPARRAESKRIPGSPKGGKWHKMKKKMVTSV